MVKLHFSIIIRAPREKVWKTMLDDATYRQWTEEFGIGSHYIGDWSEGSRMLFLAPGEQGESGMVSRIAANRPFDLLSIQHLGVMKDGIEDTSSEEMTSWSGAMEEYRFREVEGGTEVLVDTDTIEEYRKMFQSVWPKALRKLKVLAEAGEKRITRKRINPEVVLPRGSGISKMDAISRNT